MLNKRFCAKLPGFLIGDLIDAIYPRLGIEGYQLLKEVLLEFGQRHGMQLRKRVQSLGLETNLFNFILFNGIYEAGCFKSTGDGDTIRLNCELYQCPASHWSDRENLQKKELFGELARAILQGYNRELADGYSNVITLGSRSCDLVAQFAIGGEFNGNLPKRQ